ncbi:hypothetical protein ACFQFH_00985 [Halobaculum halobium]|uniref:Uncharacterized protein n=1 Tax=Halobaculum halobium TaxID=3032281 RepID=A0ABD5T529_9EURY|nr:hypothetical protein [Halobaculum sp. SYNS20]
MVWTSPKASTVALAVGELGVSVGREDLISVSDGRLERRTVGFFDVARDQWPT